MTDPKPPENVVFQKGYLSRTERESLGGHLAHIIWMTGLSGSGKSTLARLTERQLHEQGVRVMVLDGDNVRRGLNADLGFAPEDRDENLRRVAHVAALMADAGVVVICAFISPKQDNRDNARSLVPSGFFTEAYVRCPVEECSRRDPKGLYAKAYSGDLLQFTGVSAPYEAPKNPEIVLDTTLTDPEEDAKALVDHVLSRIRLKVSQSR